MPRTTVSARTRGLIRAACGGTFALAAASAPAASRSDVLRIYVSFPTIGPRLDATIRIDGERGVGLEDAMNGRGPVHDLLAAAELAEFREQPLFESSEAVPGLPLSRTLVFRPQTLRPYQLFFGVVGADAPRPGLAPDALRERAFADFQIEVDGVGLDGSRLRTVGPFSCAGGGSSCTAFNATQWLVETGAHQVVYRFRTAAPIGDCANGACLPAGQWEWRFPIVIDARPAPAPGAGEHPSSPPRGPLAFFAALGR